MTNDSSDRLEFLPVGLDVQGKTCLVVGGGSVGTRKALTLERAGAIVTVVSPTVTEELAEQIEAGRIRWVKDSFREEHLAGAFLMVGFHYIVWGWWLSDLIRKDADRDEDS